MWTRTRGTIYLLAALVTIVAGAVVIHQYTATKEGRWVMTWVSVDALKLFVVLVLLLLPWVAFMKSWFVERDFKTEKKKREDDYQAWIKERGLEISNRCITEYRVMKGNLDGFAATSLQNLETALGGFNAKLEAISASDDFKRHLTNAVGIGVELQSWLRQSQLAGSPRQPQEDRVRQWEQQTITSLGLHRPNFRAVFATAVEPPTGADALFYRLTVKIERLNALRATLI